MKFYWTNPGWTVVLYQETRDGGQLCVWDGRFDSYGEAMLNSANALKRFVPDVLRLDRVPKAKVLEEGRRRR